MSLSYNHLFWIDADFDDEYADLIDHIIDMVFNRDTVNIEPDRLARSVTTLGFQNPVSLILMSSVAHEQVSISTIFQFHLQC